MEGNTKVDKLMQPVLAAIERHVKERDAKTDIYNRAYEALYDSTVENENLSRELAEEKEATTTLRSLCAELVEEAELYFTCYKRRWTPPFPNHIERHAALMEKAKEVLK